MIKVLFVCHGNICRSPMAEFIMKDMALKQGVADRMEIASCATSSEEIFGGIGNPVYPPARAELLRHGIDPKGKRAQRLTTGHYEQYDMLIAMDDNNIRNMHRMLGVDTEGKIYKLMDFTDRGGNVADPWYSDRFDIAYRDIYDGCVSLLKYLTQKGFKV